MNDETDLRELFAHMCRAWTDGDAHAYAACFTDDCAYVSYDGALTTGRAAVAAAHDRLFRGVLFGSALVGEVESVHPLGPDTALLHGTGSVQVAWRSRPPRRRATRNTLVAVREAGGWRFAAIHNGRIRPVTVPEPGSVPARMARALVGAAAAVGLGRAHSSARGPR